MLFVYDIRGARMRVEVGPGLEGIFPDGFVGYLMREQTAAFFAAGNSILGLKSTLFIVNFRLREAALNETYDPRKISWIMNAERLAAGAGATAMTPVGRDEAVLQRGPLAAAVAARFGPQPTVAAARDRYLEALHEGYFQPDLPLYAPGGESALRAFPAMVPEFADSEGADISREARDFWRHRWSGQTLMAIGAQDPVLGLPVMEALRADIRGCPEPMVLEDAGHFVQERGEGVARGSVEFFCL